MLTKIYAITNKINGKKYIGQTIQTLRRRFTSHWDAANSRCRKTNKLKSNNPFHNALRKYGRENFTIEEIANASTYELADDMERKFISELNTMLPNGYNTEAGGCRNRGPLSEITRKKLSEKAKQRWLNPEYKEKVSKHLRNKTPSWIANIAASSIGKKANENQLRALSLGWGYKHPPGAVVGEKNPRAKLSEHDVKEIRRLYWSNPGIVPGKRDQHIDVKISQSDLAKMYGVKQVTISKILTGDNWSEAVPDEYIGKFTWEPRSKKRKMPLRILEC